MALCVTKIGLHSFIVSLAFMVIVRGLCLAITGGTPLSCSPLPPSSFIGQGNVYGPPVVIIIFAVVVAIFDFGCAGRLCSGRSSTPGRNEKAAEYSGIRTDRVKFWCIVPARHLRCRRRHLHGPIRRGDAQLGASAWNSTSSRPRSSAGEPQGRLHHSGAILGIALLSRCPPSLILPMSRSTGRTPSAASSCLYVAIDQDPPKPQQISCSAWLAAA